MVSQVLKALGVEWETKWGVLPLPKYNAVLAATATEGKVRDPRSRSPAPCALGSLLPHRFSTPPSSCSPDERVRPGGDVEPVAGALPSHPRRRDPLSPAPRARVVVHVGSALLRQRRVHLRCVRRRRAEAEGVLAPSLLGSSSC